MDLELERLINMLRVIGNIDSGAICGRSHAQNSPRTSSQHLTILTTVYAKAEDRRLQTYLARSSSHLSISRRSRKSLQCS